MLFYAVRNNDGKYYRLNILFLTKQTVFWQDTIDHICLSTDVNKADRIAYHLNAKVVRFNLAEEMQ